MQILRSNKEIIIIFGGHSICFVHNDVATENTSTWTEVRTTVQILTWDCHDDVLGRMVSLLWCKQVFRVWTWLARHDWGRRGVFYLSNGLAGCLFGEGTRGQYFTQRKSGTTWSEMLHVPNIKGVGVGHLIFVVSYWLVCFFTLFLILWAWPGALLCFLLAFCSVKHAQWGHDCRKGQPHPVGIPADLLGFNFITGVQINCMQFKHYKVSQSL